MKFFSFSVAAAVLAASSSSFAAAQSVDSSDLAEFQFEFGTGDEVAHLVIDFANTGSTPGGAFGFSYRFDALDDPSQDAPSPTLENLLVDLNATEAVSVFLDFESFPAFGPSVNGFAVQDDEFNIGALASADNTFFQLFLVEAVGQAFGSGDVAFTGARSTVLSDGLVAGFGLTEFDPATFATVSQTLPRTFVPEPASAVLLAGAGTLLLGRRRSQGAA